MSSFVILPERGLITVGGPDRAEFLQGLISNDINHVASDRVIWAALLTPQGKYLHDFFVTESDGSYLLDCEAERLMDLGQRLSHYKLRAEIDLGMSDSQSVAAIYGDGIEELLGLPAKAGAAVPFGGGVAYMDPRLIQMGARAVLPKETAEEALSDAGLSADSLEAYDAHRLALGLPDGSRDLVIEKSILLESNFDELNGVDWDKGCYMGQELTARTKYRGLIKKRLVPVAIEGDAPEPGTPILCDGKRAGEMRSARDGAGLALLRLEYLERALEGEGPFDAGGSDITPRKPDWGEF
ncbi:MAG TPA: folate-binding protein [Rhodospirillaceae bacterium]|nr:glycine cleavage system protein T [Rhodospirillaceae bacterium]HAA90838.1 folate-binding protein [Rhodospirillaceae bacterium]HAT34709.1 folate-binding protein [Rhodospirillaceae bacterium]